MHELLFVTTRESISTAEAWHILLVFVQAVLCVDGARLVAFWC